MEELAVAVLLILAGAGIVAIALFAFGAFESGDSGEVIVNDKAVKVHMRGFNIVCDLDKQMGIAFVGSDMSSDDERNNVGGMLTPEQYNVWCAPLDS